jgi:hypothetical protein
MFWQKLQRSPYDSSAAGLSQHGDHLAYLIGTCVRLITEKVFHRLPCPALAFCPESELIKNDHAVGLAYLIPCLRVFPG